METVILTPLAGGRKLAPATVQASRHDLGDGKTGFVVIGLKHSPGTTIEDAEGKVFTVLSAAVSGSEIWYVTR